MQAGWNLKALFLNCTLKKSPEVSNTDALIEVIADLMAAMGVECETVRLADYKIAYGTESDMGDGDEWPRIYEKIKAADILVPSMPIWMGVRSSRGRYQPADGPLGRDGRPRADPCAFEAGAIADLRTCRLLFFLLHDGPDRPDQLDLHDLVDLFENSRAL